METMSDIRDEVARLKAQRDAIDGQLRALERSGRERSKEAALRDRYFKAPCVSCGGTGKVMRGFDLLELCEDICDECRGPGWVWIRKFDGQGDHDMDYDNREG